MGKVLNAGAAVKSCTNCGGLCPYKPKYWRAQTVTANGIEYAVSVRCEYGKEADLTSRSIKAGIPRRYASKTPTDYDVTESNREAVMQAHWYLEDRPECSLYYSGGCGTGKTLLAAIVGRELIRQGVQVVFTDFPTVLEELKTSFDDRDKNSEEILSRYQGAEMLIMDDVGSGYFKDWGVGILHQIVNGRYNAGLPMIVTSNFDYRDLEKRLTTAEAYAANRIVSRLAEMCEAAYFGTVDRRLRS